jgi:hypothetical protein
VAYVEDVELPHPHLLKNVLTIYETRKLNTVFTRDIGLYLETD